MPLRLERELDPLIDERAILGIESLSAFLCSIACETRKH
jgi:hypothetical protein